jgi:hypothetical protein
MPPPPILPLLNQYSFQDNSFFLAPHIPPKPLKNALKAYAKEVKPEEALLLIDTTVFGGAREGCLLTQEAIYGHNFGESPQKVYWKDLFQATLIQGRISKLYLNQKHFLDFPQNKPVLPQFHEFLLEIASQHPSLLQSESTPQEILTLQRKGLSASEFWKTLFRSPRLLQYWENQSPQARLDAQMWLYLMAPERKNYLKHWEKFHPEYSATQISWQDLLLLAYPQRTFQEVLQILEHRNETTQIQLLNAQKQEEGLLFVPPFRKSTLDSFRTYLAQTLFYLSHHVTSLEDFRQLPLPRRTYEPLQRQFPQIATTLYRERQLFLKNLPHLIPSLETLPQGRFLLYSPQLAYSSPSGQNESSHFFDTEQVPPWETWICLVFEEQNNAAFASLSPYLLCWIPPFAYPYVEKVLGNYPSFSWFSLLPLPFAQWLAQPEQRLPERK